VGGRTGPTLIELLTVSKIDRQKIYYVYGVLDYTLMKPEDTDLILQFPVVDSFGIVLSVFFYLLVVAMIIMIIKTVLNNQSNKTDK
jgi:hypothetical protein